VRTSEALGYEEDGVKIWRADRLSAVCNVGNQTFQLLLEKGDPHTVVAVNCTWSTGSDIGQLWQRCAVPLVCDLRANARQPVSAWKYALQA
jgi:hypothetical protein